MRLAVITIAIFLFSQPIASAETINVPDDYPTIQQAIDAAANGDTVLVGPGTYVENIDFLGKAIHVLGDEGSMKTIIDGNKAGSVVTFEQGEDEQSILSGFTISNGSGTVVTIGAFSYVYGAGIYCNGASPTISDNYIVNNEIEDTGWAYAYSGGGLYCANQAAPRIEDNVFEQNQANLGGAIFCHAQASPAIRRNTIIYND
ncbi:MAG: right-handed parallel beta-helix repeat-containing protein, partial [Planctomycetota bacterium]